jgi:tryptophanyl-tRNA synthetase
MKRILTGDRPTGKLHLGHYVGTLANRVKLQNEYDTYIMIANIQGLTDNFNNPSKVRDNIIEVIKDYYAVGLDFNKCKIFIQSEVSAINEIFVYLSNFVSVQKIMHNPTIKTEIAEKGMSESTPLGFFYYPIHQVADILCVKADLVPVGKDQAPMIEDAREIARKFNQTYSVNILPEPEALFGVTENLPGTDGNSKMSKSLNNCIYLSDDDETLRKKVNSIYTDPTRVKATDKGHLEGNVAFIYHDIFNTNKDEVKDLKDRYVEGKVGDVEVKEKLFIALKTFLDPIRERRKEAEQKQDELFQNVLASSKAVSDIANQTLSEMKEVMKIKF